MSRVGFNGIDALHSHALMDVKFPGQFFLKGCSVIVLVLELALVLERKVYNNDDRAIFSVY